MSTRANVIIKDASGELFFYRHSDGYPECTGESLKKFCEGYRSKLRCDLMQSSGWLIIQGREEYADIVQSKGYQWKVGAYEPSTGLSGDAEYVYIIDLNEHTIEYRKTIGSFWDDPSLENTKHLSRENFKVGEL